VYIKHTGRNIRHHEGVAENVPINYDLGSLLLMGSESSKPSAPVENQPQRMASDQGKAFLIEYCRN